MLRKALPILLVMCLIAALPAAGPAAGSAAAKPAEAAKKKQKGKQQKKKKKRKQKKTKAVPTRLWYRVAVHGTGTKTDRSAPGPTTSTTTTTTQWEAPSRSAVILRREPAPIPPGAKPAFDHRFKVGFSARQFGGTSTLTSTGGGLCGGSSSSFTQTGDGAYAGTVDGIVGNGPGHVNLVFHVTYPGQGLQDFTPGCGPDTYPPQQQQAPGPIACPYSENWTATGDVAWGSAFTITATCRWGDTAWHGASTHVVADVTLEFSPCPRGGRRVKGC